MEKQKELKGRFNIGSIKKTATEKGKKKVEKLDKGNQTLNEDLNTLRFRIKSDAQELFNNLRSDYSLNHRKFGIDDSEFFKIATNQLKEKFTNNNDLIEANDEFIDFVTRKGKRKSTKRTPNKNETVNMVVKVDKQTNDDFLNLLYSYYMKKNKSVLYETYLSRTYFFYDFIDLISKDN
jgi:predicted N-acyltransferase